MNVQYYHFHIYYPFNKMEIASELRDELRDKLDLEVGRLWDKPVGPHPIGSCQISVPVERFVEVTHWFMENRKELDVFVHPVTGDDLKDHTDYIMWIGYSHELNLEGFISKANS